jgi:hypothetical protein
MLKTLAAYAGAVTGTFLLGSILATQFILGNVADMGMDVSLGVRLQATLHDIGGLASTYLPLIAITFLIALLIATGLLKVFPSRPGLLYLLAGGLALVSLHLTMKAVLGLSPPRAPLRACLARVWPVFWVAIFTTASVPAVWVPLATQMRLRPPMTWAP